MNNKWFKDLNLIISCKTKGLKALAQAVGSDPSIFYVNQDLSRCNLRGEDLSSMDLTGTGISISQIDDKTKIDKDFDPRFIFEQEYIRINVPFKIASLVYAYADEKRYRYKAWAFKNLIDQALKMVKVSPEVFSDLIRGETLIREAARVSPRQYRRIELQIYAHQQARAHAWAASRGIALDNIVYIELILIGLLAQKIPVLDNDRYSIIEPFSLYQRSRHFFDQLNRGEI